MAEAFVSHFYVEPPQKKRNSGFFIPFQSQTVFLNTQSVEFRNEIVQKDARIQELQARVYALEKKNTAAEKLKIAKGKENRPFLEGRKPFGELTSCRKLHKKQEIKLWLTNQFQKLPQEWKVIEVLHNTKSSHIIIICSFFISPL